MVGFLLVRVDKGFRIGVGFWRFFIRLRVSFLFCGSWERFGGVVEGLRV